MSVMRDDAQNGRFKTKVAVAAAAVCLLAVGGGGAGVWAWVQGQLQDLRYEVEVTSVHPEDNCVTLAQSMGPAIVHTLQDVIRTVPFPIELDPDALKPAPEDTEPDVVVEAPAKPQAPSDGGDPAPTKAAEPEQPRGLDPDTEPMYASAHVPNPGERGRQGQGLLEAAAQTQAMLGKPKRATQSGTPGAEEAEGERAKAPPARPEASAKAEESARAAEAEPEVAAVPKDDAEQAPERGPEDEEPACDVRVAMGFKVHNPLPLGMTVDILNVEAYVMDQKLRPDQVLISERTLSASGGEPIAGSVVFRFEAEQVMAAAGGMLMRRKVRFKGWAQVRAHVLGGLFAQDMLLPIEREITASELLRGIEGSVAAQ